MFGTPPSWSSKVGTVLSRVVHGSSRTPVLLPLLVVSAALVVAPIVTPPVTCLPEPGEVGVILGALLTAQGAIAALSLAVTLFMIQGVRARRDVDDRMYREYIRRSRMRDILWGSLLAVGVTGALLLSEGFISGYGASADVEPELRNLVLAAGLAFLVNLVFAGVLFERAIFHSRPEQWLALRRDLNEADVREAIQAFLRRASRAIGARETGELDFTILYPDQGEGSADEAVRTLLDDARRAMSERRHEELRRSLDSVIELVKHAMDEIRKTDIQWSAPGSQPEWPPLRELNRNLYAFREDTIREGDREYILELLRFDYRLISEGMRQRCGELFTVGLNGYRWNYQIAGRIGGGEFRDMLRDRFSQNADGLFLGAEPTEISSYAREMVRQQERLLSDAMRSDRPSDYDQLHRGFRAWLNALRLHWQTDDWPPSQASELHKRLEQEYRIALMGLGGRAILLAQSGEIADANPYLEVGRLSYSQLGSLAEDLAPALLYDDSPGFSLWQEWEMGGAVPYETVGMSTERYPLLFFTLRLIELSSDSMPTLDLHGRAQRALDWFMSYSESVGKYVRGDVQPTLEERREFAAEALRSAVRGDEVAEDYEIIGRNLSEARVSAFKSDVYATALSRNSVEQAFERAGVSLNLSADAADAPEELFFVALRHKGFLTDTPEGALTGYATLEGGQWGRDLSRDVLRRFCESLEGSPEILAPIETPTALLQGIDRAIEDLDVPEHVVVVLAGNWFDLQVGLGTANLEGYEASWKLPESERLGEVGRYRGHAILNDRDYVARCVYVVDLSGWGHFVRAKADGDQDLRVEINPISIDRAHELLTANPDHFASQPDEDSKLRKLQTYVEIVVGARTGFRVDDASRARRIVPVRHPDVDNEGINPSTGS